MSGLFPPNGAINQSQTVVIRMEYCGMTGLELNKFNLLNPSGSVVSTTKSVGSYWATLEPNVPLTDGVTYSVEAEGRINDGGILKQISPGTWAFTVIDVEDPIGPTLYSENFSGTGYSIPHQLSEAQLASQFGWGPCESAQVGNLTLVNDPAPGGGRGTVLKIDFYEGNYAIYSTVPGYPEHLSGMQANIWQGGKDELYFAYDIFWPDDFIFNFAMKNTRIGGGDFQANNDHVTNGGKYCECGTGFLGRNPTSEAIRTQFGCNHYGTVDGEMAIYQYYVQDFQLNERTQTAYQKGRWNRIELHVKINDPYTSANGEYHLWKDGQLIKSVTNRQWRNAVDPTMQWDAIRLVFYEGGGSGCWMAPQNQSCYIDNIIISENPITHSSTFQIEEIRKYSQNSWYWEYKDQPVLLLGGSEHSNLFQVPDLEDHLDDIQTADGNYVINVMSQRTIWNLAGSLIVPYSGSKGSYDLDTWNSSYWTMFENLLIWADERDIIVQVELWDRWDFCSTSWEDNAFRPTNNITYTTGSSGLDDTEACSGWTSIPFFRSIPAIDNNTLVLGYQQAFVDKILSYTFQYNNILYCISNESSLSEEWGQYWSEYIKTEAQSAGISVETAQMWDDWVMNSTRQKYSFDHPEIYSYLDLSQNSHQDDNDPVENHWDGLQYARTYVSGAPRPINQGKTYGSDVGGTYDEDHAIACFWRVIIGGGASCRFHRPDAGLGLTQIAEDLIASARLLETKVNLWEMTPDVSHALLSSRATNEAYLSKEVGQQYALYFVDGGAVGLDLTAYSGDTFDIDWINADAGTWGTPDTVSGGSTQTITAPGSGPWVAAIVLQ